MKHLIILLFFICGTTLNCLAQESVEYWKNGSVKSEGQYTNEAKTGIWKYYFENKQIWKTGTYIAVTEADTIMVVDPTTSEETYVITKPEPGSFVEDGKWIYYNEKGNIINEIIYNKGTIIQETKDY